MGILDDAIREHLELKRAHGAAEQEVQRQEAEALGPARREPPPAAGFGAEPPVDAPLSAAPDPDDAVSFDEGAPPPPDPDAIGPAPELVDAPPPAVDEDTQLMPAADLPVSDEEPFSEPAAEVAPFDEEPPPILDDEVPLHEQVAPEPVFPNREPEPLEPLPPEPDPEPELRAPIDDAETRLRHLPPLDDDSLPPEPALPLEPEPYGAALPVQEPPVDEPPVQEPPVDEPPVQPAAEDEEDGEDLLEETPDFLQETPEHDRLWFEQKPPRDFDFDD
jgi:hypothetical protein